MPFQAPLRDMRFQIWDVLDGEAHLRALAEAGVDVSRDLLDAVLDEGARFSAEVLAPLNAVGDREGCVLADGAVRTPTGFREAFAQYAAGGWSAMNGDTAYGGQGLPPSWSMFVEEMVSSANMAFGMYPGLSRGAAGAIEAHGTPAQKSVYLQRLLEGRWTGTMCLTEPHAGSDVGLLRTRAVPAADGSYRISGEKIFISAGEHDLAENIVHLVLARLPDAPAGTRGISLFIVPKLLPDAQGALAADGSGRNGVRCTAIEHKMGINGSATCQLLFDGATGFLLGPENGGMRCMFTMMNMARVIVGVQGLSLMEAAYQKSIDYALERLQMRSLTGPKAPDKPADPLLVHPDIRRMLLTQKALVEGCRHLLYRAGLLEDRVRAGIGDAARNVREMDLLTPICKAFATEAGFESVNQAVQIYGGHGYIRDNGVEQFVRDSRITMIYEGTTQIQALDLLGRKVATGAGASLREVIEAGIVFASAQRDSATLGAWAGSVIEVYGEWGALAQHALMKGMADPEEVGAAAVDFLMYSGYALLAEGWLRQATAAERGLATNPDDAFLQGKLATARFYFERLLPRRLTLAATIRAGGGALMAPTAAQFGQA